MNAGGGDLRRWTRYFAVAAAGSLVVAEAVALSGGGRRLVAAVAVFGVVCPMIFGMGYLLLPSLVGRTLAQRRLPGVHLVLAYAGGALIVGHRIGAVGTVAFRLGVAAWSLGVALFLGSVLWTAVPAVWDRPEVVLRSPDLPQRSSRLATAVIPVALGYLLVGTVALLGRAGLVPAPLPTAFPRVVHYHAAGLGALLIFGLGARLMPGFFHVTPPRRTTWVVLAAGALAPAALATRLLGGIWFRVGAALEATAMVGYAALVVVVYRRSDWHRVGLDGILLGALAGALAVAIGLSVAFGGATTARLAAHASVVVTGFFGLTIAGYAAHFFALTAGGFAGATEQTVRWTFMALAAGAALQAVGHLWTLPPVWRLGSLVALLAAGSYCYLLACRLLQPAALGQG